MTDSFVSSIDETFSTIATSLLHRSQERDQQAWERLVHLYSPLVYSWCRRNRLSPEDAADVGQEVFLAAASKLSEFHRDQPGDTFRGWLRTITKNKIHDHWKKQQAEPAATGGSDAQAPLDLVALDDANDSGESIGEEHRMLFRRVADLVQGEFAARDWEAFFRVVAQQEDPHRVAEDLGMTRNQVYLAKSRILKRIRTEFGVKDKS